MCKLTDKILEHGIENCIFMVPMKPVQRILGFGYTSSDDPDVVVPAKINEERYKVKKNYKITLQSTYETFGKQSFYLSDLNRMVEDGRVDFYIKG